MHTFVELIAMLLFLPVGMFICVAVTMEVIMRDPKRYESGSGALLGYSTIIGSAFALNIAFTGGSALLRAIFE